MAKPVFLRWRRLCFATELFVQRSGSGGLDSLMKVIAACSFVALFCSAQLLAQDNPAPASRAEEIESEQAAKAQTLSPDVPDKGERQFVHAETDTRNILQRSTLHLQFGGLPYPAVFALGPTVQWRSANDKVRTNLWGIVSINEFYSTGIGVEMPRVTSRRFDVTLRAEHRDLPQLDFYGEGPDSRKSQRTDYRQEDTRFEAGVNWPVGKHVQPHCKAEELLLNVGPGTSDTVTSTPLKFSSAQAPGLDVQSNFLVGGCGLQLDSLDSPSYPRRGAALLLDYRDFVAQQRSINSFHRATGSVEQYIPFFNSKRVIALHAAADMTFHNSNQVVPFYMQPTLGGFNDLRGFRPLRFHDENAVVASAEYRWEICTGFDMAIFGDSGEVFHRPALFNLSRLQNDVGFGLRFNNQRDMFMRIDTGFSREGFQVWVAFNKTFSLNKIF